MKGGWEEVAEGGGSNPRCREASRREDPPQTECFRPLSLIILVMNTFARMRKEWDEKGSFTPKPSNNVYFKFHNVGILLQTCFI